MSEMVRGLANIIRLCNAQYAANGTALISETEPFLQWLSDKPDFVALFCALGQDPLSFDLGAFGQCFMPNEVYEPNRVRLYLRVWRGEVRAQSDASQTIATYGTDMESDEVERENSFQRAVRDLDQHALVSRLHAGMLVDGTAAEKAAHDESERQNLAGKYGAIADVQRAPIRRDIFVLRFEGEEWLVQGDTALVTENLKAHRLANSAERVLVALLGVASLNTREGGSSIRLTLSEEDRRLNARVDRFVALMQEADDRSTQDIVEDILREL